MSTPARPLTGRRALIVEDEGLFALELTETLAGLGCAVVDVAAGLSRGLAAAEFHELDLAVVDVHLGRDKAFRIAHMLMARQVPFLFVTGAGRDAIPVAFDEIPALIKPFTPTTLREALLSLLGSADADGRDSTPPARPERPAG
ncbi:MAG TPA: response regulator [Phenylobacterium sp.]